MEHRIELRIKEKISETNQAVTLVLEPIVPNFHYRAGQFLTLLFDQISPKPLRRSYSFSTCPEVDARPAITVKKVPNGRASRYLTEQAQPGDLLQAIAPAGQFVVPPTEGTARVVCLIGGGCGITPLFALRKQVLQTERQSRVILVYANSNEDRIIFRTQLRELVRQFPDRLQVIHLLSQTRRPLPDLRQAEAPAQIRTQRLSNALVQTLVEEALHFDRATAQFFVCGPKNLMLKAVTMLHYMQFESAQIHQEIFTIVEPYRPPAERYPDSRVRLRYRGQDFEIPVQKGNTILEAAEKNGLILPFSCRSGICTTCAATCRSGNVEMFVLQGQIDVRQSNGLVFTCVGYPLTPEVEITIGT